MTEQPYPLYDPQRGYPHLSPEAQEAVARGHAGAPDAGPAGAHRAVTDEHPNAAYWQAGGGRPIEPPGDVVPGLGPQPYPAESPPPATPPAAAEPGAEDGDVDFDAWLRQYASEQPHITLFGDRVPIPFDMPLWIVLRIEAGVDHEQDFDIVKTMIDALYGAGRADRWINQGNAGSFGLMTIVAWTFMRASGEKVSFEEATRRAQEKAAEVQTQQAQEKAASDRLGAAAAQYGADSPEARAEAAAIQAASEAGKAPSFGGGGPSKQTSGVSTASPAPSWGS